MSELHGPFWHADHCPDRETGHLTDQCTCGQREAVQRMLNPGPIGTDLRSELARTIEKWIPGPVFPPLLDGMQALVERRIAQARAEDARVIVANTLRTIAEWVDDDRSPAELEALAQQIERYDGYMSCPMCQHDPCHQGCPLARQHAEEVGSDE